jgi:hypothetical protein
MDARTAFVLDSRLEFEAQQAGGKTERLELVVKMAADGTHYLQSDRGRLYFGRHEGTFYFYRLEGNDERLRMLFLALPRLPLVAREGLSWTDFVPVGVATRGVKCALIRFLGSFYPELARVTVTQTYTSAGRIVSRCRSRILGLNSTAEVELDERLGFSKVSAGSWVLRRINSSESREQEKGHEPTEKAGRVGNASTGRLPAVSFRMESGRSQRRAV